MTVGNHAVREGKPLEGTGTDPPFEVLLLEDIHRIGRLQREPGSCSP
jgi:hypothetical protein